ncbi:tetratricopeptide (TPR) repeat protein [Nocardioides sp. BE266]|uniref:tetratricopeptide repeat protein n=1 Tax=Nocardioides sp. BE266 TaxID=2817725 RepID=UPI00285B2659|nr:tetratricopeptide repeat protein [Nocardioides sp. BE266]MDR7251790.1 tetratricopeptide (TPR) repeat protein [Nocardioides sp. BE266]
MATVLRDLWDFDDPEGSEQRFRTLAADAAEPEASCALTQVARALGLRERYDDGHAVLDRLSPDDPEVRVRLALERGRLVRSGGDPGAARPLFEEAAAQARDTGLEELEVDALHMVALVVDPADQLAAHEVALDRARSASDPVARDWDASLLNNIGMTHADAGDHAAALVAFEDALEARERIGDLSRTRVAKWMVAWSLRHLGRVDEARAMQRALKAELEAAGEHDPYVDEELGLLG